MDRVLERMKWPVISIFERCSVATARAKLGLYDIDRLPVIDATGQLVGIVTTTDLAWANSEEFVSDYLTRDVIAISPLASLMDARVLLQQHEVSGLPVTVGNIVVGVVTWRDLREEELVLVS